MGRAGRLASLAAALAAGGAVGHAGQEAGYVQFPPLPTWASDLQLPPLPTWASDLQLPPLPSWAADLATMESVEAAASWGREWLSAASLAASRVVNAAEPHLEALSRGRQDCGWLHQALQALQQAAAAVEPRAEALVAGLRPGLQGLQGLPGGLPGGLRPASARLPATALLALAALAAVGCLFIAVRLLLGLLRCIARPFRSRQAVASATEAGYVGGGDLAAVEQAFEEVSERGRSATKRISRSRADSPVPFAVCPRVEMEEDEDQATPVKRPPLAPVERPPLGELTQNVVSQESSGVKSSRSSVDVRFLIEALNTRSYEELTSLQGVGPKSAQKILEFRKIGTIECVEDLVRKVRLPTVVVAGLTRKQGVPFY